MKPYMERFEECPTLAWTTFSVSRDGYDADIETSFLSLTVYIRKARGKNNSFGFHLICGRRLILLLSLH